MSSVKAKGPLEFVRHGYAYDGDDFDPGIDCTGYYDVDGAWVDTPTLTKQSSKDECDINYMMARYQATGQFDNVNPAPPQWGDVSDVVSYQDAQNLILKSQADFAALDAKTRARFGNDPAELLRFLGNDANYDEAVKLGLVSPVVDAPPQKVEVVNAPAGQQEPPPEPKSPKGV